MQTDKLQTIKLEQLRSLFPDKNINVGKDFFLGDISFSEDNQIVQQSFRVEGYLALFCMEGEFEVSINMDTYKVTKNELIVYIPGNTMRVDHLDSAGHCVLLAVSPGFMSSMRVDFNSLFHDSMAILSSPCITLEEKEIWLFTRYVELCRDLIQWGDDLEKRDALGSLISSFYYALGSSLTRRLNDARSSEDEHQPSRSKAIFDQFMRLVNNYHTQYRDMEFYAKSLNLTPKYLSKVIKQVSGRSAPDWIDSFVILEAKNMLRYSDMPIKQIMFNLNFDNHSVFYKYFKSHTGMTPTEYRNS